MDMGILCLLIVSLVTYFFVNFGKITGTHRHKCPNCKKIWRHSDECGGDEKAHTCPRCGCESWWRY